jgi:hypothetical protein
VAIADDNLNASPGQPRLCASETTNREQTMTTITTSQIRSFIVAAGAARDAEGVAVAKRALGMTVQEIYESGCCGLGYIEVAHALRTPTNSRPMTADRARRMVADMLA